MPTLRQHVDCSQRQGQRLATLQVPGLPAHVQRTEQDAAGPVAKWLQQEDALGRGLIVRLASAELGVAPSTAFRWRHRFLQLTQPVKALVLTGVVEADETFFLRSSKGQRPGRDPRKRGGHASRKNRGEDLIPVLVARDRSGATADFLLEAVSKKCLSEALSPRVKADAILCTDGSAAMAAAAKEM
ncbi:MAG: IS1595 family transposase, partial [Betaproteobacteria bacterium]|nr:IS1595 family transposase [Betaproteobacteria bacterium]